ncbi:MAG: hypothetical protein K8W52_00755, partial [Deltaproteobacteria bacterium]|nr:hypothetical protein [Deltaproteobacteria bacterium]
MRIPALLVASLGLVGACAGTYRYEAAGRGLAQVTQDESQASAAPGTGGVAARANVRHDVIVRVAVPRAEQVAWRLDCGGDVVSGVVGETLEAYRARRSGGTYVDRAIVVPPHDGACTVALWPQDGADPTGISGAFEVTRVIRRDAELRARREVQVGQAQAARVAIRAQLIAQGADVEARARAEAAVQAQPQAQAEIRFRAEASVRARAQAEAEVRARAEAELWAEASQCRGELRAYLVAQGADPMRRRRELEARAQAELALRLRMQEEQRRRDAEAAAIAAELGHRQDLAIDARLRLRAMLLALGARERPPMPPPLDEDPGLSPSSYAAWIAGRWQWSGQAWEWQAGFWSEVEQPGAVV